MKNAILKFSDLKKIDYPHEVIQTPGSPEIVALTPEVILLSIAISTKRIADALEDGLTTLTDDGKLAGVADIMKSVDTK